MPRKIRIDRVSTPFFRFISPWLTLRSRDRKHLEWRGGCQGEMHKKSQSLLCLLVFPSGGGNTTGDGLTDPIVRQPANRFQASAPSWCYTTAMHRNSAHIFTRRLNCPALASRFVGGALIAQSLFSPLTSRINHAISCFCRTGAARNCHLGGRCQGRDSLCEPRQRKPTGVGRKRTAPPHLGVVVSRRRHAAGRAERRAATQRQLYRARLNTHHQQPNRAASAVQRHPH